MLPYCIEGGTGVSCEKCGVEFVCRNGGNRFDCVDESTIPVAIEFVCESGNGEFVCGSGDSELSGDSGFNCVDMIDCKEDRIE